MNPQFANWFLSSARFTPAPALSIVRQEHEGQVRCVAGGGGVEELPYQLQRSMDLLGFVGEMYVVCDPEGPDGENTSRFYAGRVYPQPTGQPSPSTEPEWLVTDQIGSVGGVVVRSQEWMNDLPWRVDALDGADYAMWRLAPFLVDSQDKLLKGEHPETVLDYMDASLVNFLDSFGVKVGIGNIENVPVSHDAKDREPSAEYIILLFPDRSRLYLGKKGRAYPSEDRYCMGREVLTPVFTSRLS